MKSLLVGAICFLTLGTSAHAKYLCSAVPLSISVPNVSVIGEDLSLTQTKAVQKCEIAYPKFRCVPRGCKKLK